MTAAAIRARLGAVLFIALMTALYMFIVMLPVGVISEIVFGSPVRDWSPEAKAWSLLAIGVVALVASLYQYGRDEDQEA